jgi:hypothetical protein
VPRTILFFAFTIWSILLAPGLCSAGWIDHLCADHDDASCGHEAECQDDPCASLSLKPARSESSDTDVAIAADPCAVFDASILHESHSRIRGPGAAPPSFHFPPISPLRL